MSSSNIAKKPIKIEEGITVTIADGKVVANGPRGTIDVAIPKDIEVIIEDGSVKVKKSSDSFNLEKFAGLVRATIANMIKGVSLGFEKKLELTGVGYRAKVEGGDLVLNVGFAHPVKISPIPGVAISVDENIITVSGVNKQLVGDVASNIRRVRPPEPYKGKGIKYVGEYIRRKAGKAAKAVGAATK